MKTTSNPIFEYINHYLYMVVLPCPEQGPDTFSFCSGVDTHRFYPITSEKHGIASNPAVRGLQLTRADISAGLLKNNAVPKSVKVECCAGIGSRTGVWYTENMLIEKASESLLKEIIPHYLMILATRIIETCHPKVSIPKTLPSPKELESFLDTLAQS
jgi:hypothetical protein